MDWTNKNESAWALAQCECVLLGRVVRSVIGHHVFYREHRLWNNEGMFCS
jgi:hypothetical protein